MPKQLSHESVVLCGVVMWREAKRGRWCWDSDCNVVEAGRVDRRVSDSGWTRRVTSRQTLTQTRLGKSECSEREVTLGFALRHAEKAVPLRCRQADRLLCRLLSSVCVSCR